MKQRNLREITLMRAKEKSLITIAKWKIDKLSTENQIFY